MIEIVLERLKPYDGRYPFDVDSELTTREWGWVKRLSGHMPATFDDAFRGLDAELWTVLALITLRRVGKLEAADLPDVFERFADAPFGSAIRVEIDQAEAEQEDANEDPTGSSSENGNGSGPASPTSSARSEPSPAADSGTPGLDSSAWDLTKLAT